MAPEPNSGITQPTFTEEQRKAIARYVEAEGRKRMASQPRASEIDFLAGAMSVFFALDLAFPPHWWINAVTGRPLLRDAKPKRKAVRR